VRYGQLIDTVAGYRMIDRLEVKGELEPIAAQVLRVPEGSFVDEELDLPESVLIALLIDTLTGQDKLRVEAQRLRNLLEARKC